MPMSKEEMREYQRKRREKLRAGGSDVRPARDTALLAEIEALRAENEALRATLRAAPHVEVPHAEEHPGVTLVQRYVEDALQGALSKSTVDLVSWKDRNKR